METEVLIRQIASNSEELLEQMAYNNSELIAHLVNIEQGLQILLYIAVAFFVWKVITVLYKLFAGVFFGGV